jgi:O-antigen biosynthesis protein
MQMANKNASSSYLAQGNAEMRAGCYEKSLRFFELALAEAPSMSRLIQFNINLARSRLGKLPAESPEKPLGAAKPDCYGLHADHNSIDIVIPVYNALEDVQRCLHSLVKCIDGFDVTVYVVNDRSESATSDWLREFCHSMPMLILIENDINQGYTKSVNIGLRRCKGDFIVTLNSDTIVTPGWLSGLVRCFKSDPTLGVVGPLSNAASWQNVPDLMGDDKKFAINELPKGWSPNDMAVLVRRASKHFYPRVPFVNGFCFMIAKAAFEKVGFLDEETFPTGYGEENDYCIRVEEAGFRLAVCDDTYVFHAKSKSFGHEKRNKLSKAGSQALMSKHGKDKVSQLANQIRSMEVFSVIRKQIKDGLSKAICRELKDPLTQRILFLLPVSGGGGGVHSIVQETIGMRRIGIHAIVAVPKKHRAKFIEKYKDVDIREEIFVGYGASELVNLSRSYDIIVGTIYTSMRLVKDVVAAIPDIQPAYYVQDYEPFFSEPGSPEWHEARESYMLVPDTILFAKTDWICQKVYQEHGTHVYKVMPSIDHDVYKPDPCAKQRAGLEGKIVLSAMIRPKTPRRGAKRTMQLLKCLYEQFGEKLHIELFGCDENDSLFQQQERRFKYSNSGVLTRLGVAAVLQRSDCFLDLSDYQAFGRTGLEAMACGALPILTSNGGIYEYAKHNMNSLVIDVFDDKSSLEVVSDFLRGTPKIANLKLNCLLTASRYSIHRAALSELKVLCDEGIICSETSTHLAEQPMTNTTIRRL